MKKLLLIFFAFICSTANAQIYYYQSGSPADPSNWNSQLDGSGAPALDFTAPTDYVIPTGRTALAFSPWNFGGPGSKLRVYAGAVLQNNLGILIHSNATFALDSGSLYINNNESNAALTIFNGYEIFNKYSTVRIDDWHSNDVPVYTGVSVNFANYYFGNLQINWTSQSNIWEQRLISSSPALCENNFIMDNTGTSYLIFHGLSFNSGHARVVIKGDFIQNGGEISLWSNYNYPEIYPANIELHKNFIQNGGTMGAGYGAAFGKITFAKQVIGGPDTAYQTFYTYDPTLNNLPSMRYNVNPWGALRLMSDMYGSNTDTAAGLYVNGGSGGASAALDLQNFKLKNNIRFKTEAGVYIYIRSPQGFKDGDSGNVPLFPGLVNISPFSHIIFAGTESQITGSDAPDFISSLYISNPWGVTLSKNLRAGTIILDSGKLNLSNYNLTIGNPNFIANENQNNFINTNGTGYLKAYINLPVNSMIAVPVGNNSYSPLRMIPQNGNTADTFWFKVHNDFSLPMPSDTSYCLKKNWEILEHNPGGSVFYMDFQWMRGSDEGINFRKVNNQNGSFIGVLNGSGYNGYKPYETLGFVYPFGSPQDTSVSWGTAPIAGMLFTEFNSSIRYVVGLERGIYEHYFYNANNAASLNSWKKNENGTGSSPLNFDRYSVFNVLQNKNASFNSSVTFTNKTKIRIRGNGQFTSNQPVTNLGRLDFYDSASYNHNNIGVAENTIFAGEENFYDNTNYNILMWSDTAHNFRKGVQFGFVNVTINFTNLADPGPNGRWRVGGLVNTNIICKNLKYIQSSGYDLCPVGFGYQEYMMWLHGNLQIGDSILAPDANPIINLSYGTQKSSDSSAGALLIGGDLDIQRGGIHSEQNIFMAKGRLVFHKGLVGKSKHYISSYQSFDVPIFNCGSSSYPNAILDNQHDTVVLRTNFYNSQNPPLYSTDMFEVQSRNVLDCDTFALRGMSVRVKSGGKIIIRNKQGMNFDLHAFQNITLEPGATIEFAGYETQNLYKAGSTPVPVIPNLVVNNQHGVNLNEIVTVTDTLKFIEGKLNSSLVYLYLTDTTASTGMDTASYIDAPVRLFTTSTLVKMIPFGKAGRLRPLYFQPTNTAPTEWVMYYDTQDPHLFGSSLAPGLTSLCNNEYYVINRFGPPTSAYVGMSYGPESGISSPDSLRVAHWNGSIWENAGAISYVGNQTSGYVWSDVVINFSPFAIASTNDQPLPIELASFTAATDKNHVMLNWATGYEANNSGFDIERKLITDSVWKKISFVQGSGNSNSIKNYKYEDRNLISGKYNYRLKQIDYNGNFTYYNLEGDLNVGIPEKFALSQNYPNPFNPSTKINFELPNDSRVTIQVFDITGRLIASVINGENYSAGYHTVQFNASSFASGTYFYRMTAGEFIQTKKMQLVK